MCLTGPICHGRSSQCNPKSRPRKPVPTRIIKGSNTGTQSSTRLRNRTIGRSVVSPPEVPLTALFSPFDPNNATAYGKNQCTNRCSPAPFCGDKAVDGQTFAVVPMVAVRQIGYVSVTFDHRVVDGARAAEFGLGVIRRLEDQTGWSRSTAEK